MANTNNNNYEKELQKVYEQYRRDEISVNEIPPGMLFAINRMLKEERCEMVQVIREMEKFLHKAEQPPDDIHMTLFVE